MPLPSSGVPVFGWKQLRFASLIVLASLGVASADLHADTHIYAGAAGLKPGDPLVFTVAHLFDARSGYLLPMVRRTNGLNAGYYRGDTLTFTALAATDLGTGQLEGRALLGSRLAVQVVSVDGPADGSIAYWEGDGENPGNRITFSVKAGTTNSESWFLISENNGAPGSDPYGHIHGRAFTADRQGLYTVGFRLLDVSTNGPAGGPLHSPSQVLNLRMHAGPLIEQIQADPNGFRILFRSAPGVSNVLEFADLQTRFSWTPASAPLRGNSSPQMLIDTNPVSAGRIYRLRLLNIPP